MAQQRSEGTRTRILEAAQECFAQRGYDATGVAEICQRAGLSKGALYHHFPTKQAIFLELLDRWLAGLDIELEAVRADAGNIPDKLLRMAGMVTYVFQAARGQLPIFLEFWTKAAHDPVIWRALLAHYQRYEDFFAEMIRAGVAEGSLRPTDANVAARAIISFAIGLVLQGLLDPEGADWGKIAQEGLQMMLQGLK